MIAVLLKVLPFFALIGLGYGAAKVRFFSEESVAAITRFVFYFALSAMLFRFSATLSFSEIFDPNVASAYLLGTAAVYSVATVAGFLRRQDVQTTAIEAQSASIGNTGFLGVPMLAVLLGQEAVGPIILMLSVDLIVFSSLLVILVSGARGGGLSPALLGTVARGLVNNPMIVSIVAGLAVSASGLPMPAPVESFLTTLGNAATPGALFAIGASLATKSAERLAVAGWISFCKLVLHPGFVALAAYFVFPVTPYQAAVMVSASALPVAGNVFILAQHYGIAPQRVSAAILISTAASILTVSAVIAWVHP
ncbi:AEC family transporter [Alloyangia pacifica]|uniref:AEC family transporter n=1 Tax=Alloyangia pacifica TaxID=311180 RepID=UPI001CD417E0|nr:AEC family transporter [Alloyangia pacifica]MCA0995244.1 AEC family transporter [Alloyangia pacifica]